MGKVLLTKFNKEIKINKKLIKIINNFIKNLKTELEINEEIQELKIDITLKNSTNKQNNFFYKLSKSFKENFILFHLDKLNLKYLKLISQDEWIFIIVFIINLLITYFSTTYLLKMIFL